MFEKELTITDPIGIHARPAALLIQAIKGFTCNIEVLKGDKKVNGKSLISLMGLGAKEGDKIIVRTDGEDAEEALNIFAKFIEENL